MATKKTVKSESPKKGMTAAEIKAFQQKGFSKPQGFKNGRKD